MMKSSKLMTIGVAMMAAFGASAQSEEPIITFHTNIYETYGATNSFHIVLGATEPTYIDIDYGFGLVEEEIQQADFDSDAGGMTGTAISMTVSEEGIVKIYGDASKIDYVDFEGCYISDITWPQLTEVQILDLQHNELKALDLSHMTKLAAVYLDDNPFSEASPLVIGTPKPDLMILSMNAIDYLTPDFDLTQYPGLKVLDAHDIPTLTKVDPTNCPGLLQLSIDGTNVSELDVTKNTNLLILNISETRVTNIDVSKNPYLTELYAQHIATLNQGYKLNEIDVTNNPELVRFYVNGNNLQELDLSHNDKIMSFGCRRNHIKELNFDNMEKLTLVDISQNDMTFATMPLPRTTFSEYNYDQNPVAMHRSYCEGTEWDFSQSMLREGGTTAAALFAVNRETPSDPILLDDEYYTWTEEGKFKVNKAYSDSVYIAFHNSLFPEYDMTTSKFMVKTAEQIGQKLAAVSLTFSTLVKNEPLNLYVGADGATEQTPVKFFVDPGDGSLVECVATSSVIPAEANVTTLCKGPKVVIYTDENVDISALKFNDRRLNGTVDVSNAAMLRELEITNSNLRSIDLKWNRCLRSINLSGNAMSSLDLTEPNTSYAKTVLTHVDLSNNALTDLQLTDIWGLRYLDVSNNKLTSVVTSHGSNLKYLNISGNQISELAINDLEAIEILDASNNLLTELLIPTYVPLQRLDISGNCFSLPDLTIPGFCPEYIYAPQQPISIATKAPAVNLSAQYMVIDGVATSYEWRYASDNTVVAEGNITEGSNGRFRFTNPDTGIVYCAISHPAFPQFAGDNILRTTDVQTADIPTNMFASFVTAEDGEAELSLAAAARNTVIYIDWTGNGDFEQYDLQTQYTLYSAETTAGATVKCYSYDENDGVTVMSVRNTALNAFDVSAMKSLTTLGLSGSKIALENVKFPADGQLKEFLADNCGFTTLPTENLSGVTLLNVMNNPLGKVDISALKNIEGFYADGCQLTEIIFDNPKLWNLYINKNEFETIDLSKLPALQQLFANFNNLKSINIEANSNLRVMQLDGNRFDFTTLPLPSSKYLVYTYYSQQPIEIEPNGGVVDLSSQAVCNGVDTEYTWYIDTPYFDDYGNLVGEDLYVDEEYTIENGVTSFLKTFKNVMCVMTNATFPNLYLYTNLMDINEAGVEEVTVDATNAPVEYFNLQGIRIENPGTGIYIRRQGDKSTKVLRK